MEGTMTIITKIAIPAGTSPTLTQRVTALPMADKALLKGLFGVALLALGLAGGFVTALARAGALTFFPEDAYRLLTLHGVSVFFYWLYLIQAALLLVLAAAENGRGLTLRPMAWLGAALMVAGFGISEWISATGTPLLYDGSPELGLDDPSSVGFFALGYLLLSGGLVASAVSGIATVLQPRLRGEADAFTAIGFALFAWAGFLMSAPSPPPTPFCQVYCGRWAPGRSPRTTVPNGTSCSTTCITCR
jgi:cytochrome c oxidase subunit I